LSRHGQHPAGDAVQQQDRHREEHQMVSTARQLARKVEDMNDEEADLYYYRAAFRSALLWSVVIVVLMALIAWLI
jgi:hypothetical protein